MGRCECGCGRIEREVLCACGCGKMVAEIRGWERKVRRASEPGRGGKKCGFGCGRTEKEGRKRRERRREERGRRREERRREERERRAARKECERVRQMARDRYSGGWNEGEVWWDLGGVNGRLWSGSGKLGDRGGTPSGRQAG